MQLGADHASIVTCSHVIKEQSPCLLHGRASSYGRDGARGASSTWVGASSQRPQKSPSALEPCKCSSCSRHQQASRRCGRRTRYIARTSVGVHPRGKRWWWSRKYCNTISTTTVRCVPRFSRTIAILQYTKVPGAKQQSTAVGRDLHKTPVVSR